MTEEGRERGIVNTFDQMKAYGGDRIAIGYQGYGDSRAIQSPGWHVFRIVDGQEMAQEVDLRVAST